MRTIESLTIPCGSGRSFRGQEPRRRGKTCTESTAIDVGELNTSESLGKLMSLGS